MESHVVIERPTYIEVNLAHLSHNLYQIRDHVQVKIMPIVKANAYGHGLIPVAWHLVSLGVEQLGVAFLEEGIALRKAGIQLPILVLGGIFNNQTGLYLDYNLEITVSSIDKLKQVEAAAEARKKKAVIHLKVDTGMERIGVHSYSAKAFIEKALASKHCHFKGLYSHLACADDPESPMTLEQHQRFQQVVGYIEKIGAPMPLRHLANSGGILHFPETHLDMVRPGITLYGVYPDPASKQILKLKPALSLKSRVVYFKVVHPHQPVSYGATWKADHMVRILTVPVGYGDGYSRAFSNCGQVLIHGKRYPIVGRVCMDQFMVNIEWDSAYNEDEVVLIGAQGQEQITVEELALKVGTIPYEILTGLNDRLPRKYVI
ncbi:alanine racemase [Deltaproteobacteria bacterium TL4]